MSKGKYFKPLTLLNWWRCQRHWYMLRRRKEIRSYGKPNAARPHPAARLDAYRLKSSTRQTFFVLMPKLYYCMYNLWSFLKSLVSFFLKIFDNIPYISVLYGLWRGVGWFWSTFRFCKNYYFITDTVYIYLSMRLGIKLNIQLFIY